MFVGTRVPVKNLFDYLGAGGTMEDFLDDFPGVSRAQAIAAVHEAAEVLVRSATPA